MSQKTKSSALLIAIIIGTILVTLVIGVTLAMTQHAKLADQAREGKIAYRAALSGIEDGLLRYKYARAQGNQSGIFGIIPGEFKISDEWSRPPKATYRLAIKMASLTTSSDFSTPPDGENGGVKLNIDDTADLDLTYFTSTSLITSLKIHFSAPYNESGTEIADHFTALNYRLLDASKSAESQLIGEATNLNVGSSILDVQNIGGCVLSSRCHLRIRPQSVLRSGGPSEEELLEAGRLVGGNESNPQGKYVYYKIEAYSNGQLIKPTDNPPGTITIEAIGAAGLAKRKLQVKLDSTTGAYLGLFDFGVYCGDKCEGL